MGLPRSRLLALLAVPAAMLVGAGCGDDDDGSATTDAATQPQATQPQATTPVDRGAQAPRKVKPSAGEADPDRKPKIPAGKGKPPDELEIQDLIVGEGERAQIGDTVSVQYAGVLFEDGKEFDASWNGNRRGEAFQFPLGAGQVIRGWDQGVIGMREGGRRKLLIPPELAYGAQGFPPDIPPNSALIFVIDLEQAGS